VKHWALPYFSRVRQVRLLVRLLVPLSILALCRELQPLEAKKKKKAEEKKAPLAKKEKEMLHCRCCFGLLGTRKVRTGRSNLLL